MNESEMILKICQRYGLRIQNVLALGNICKNVFKVLDRRQELLVLKIGFTQETIAEIKRNCIGYTKMDDCGLEFFKPKIVSHEETKDYELILMEYCGEDFMTQVKKADNPLNLYIELSLLIENVYRQSLKKGVDGKNMIDLVINKSKEQYEKYICKYFDEKKTLIGKIDRIKSAINFDEIRYYCFSNWDFTPEDTYLTAKGVKYSDPHEDIFGIPIIDLACFSGVALAHDLPASKEGYVAIKEFATKSVAEILSIGEAEANQLFFLGRFLQCLLSARFRIDSDIEQAEYFFLESKISLEKII